MKRPALKVSELIAFLQKAPQNAEIELIDANGNFWECDAEMVKLNSETRSSGEVVWTVSFGVEGIDEFPYPA